MKQIVKDIARDLGKIEMKNLCILDVNLCSLS